MNQNYDGNHSHKQVVQEHDVMMRGRKFLDITGVKQVESFDNKEFLLDTVMGPLSIRGDNLQMKNLDVEKGIVSIKGRRIYDLVYLDDHNGEKAKGFFSKLFK
ncbi:sporulation protein YabP [Bacillus sp. FJAT-47783]|uniref:sporulation protein YabP n=1 Tax=Bacillus sp. FJAT-47783 TaxID=2922712 RepID=UPI001FAD01DD|nr:sporulation protein YabP [Bacillus sp. FJAT-47783]